MKTARFTDVVKRAGAPDAYQLWLDPKKDRMLQRAIGEHRVMTIHQENVGTKKDYGMAGFSGEPQAQYLIFPKSVKAFADRRIVGINYALLAKDSRLEPAGAKPTTSVKRAKQARPSKKVVAFEPPAETRQPAKVATAAGGPRFVAEVTKAMKELRAGKTVPAYERLAALVERARA